MGQALLQSEACITAGAVITKGQLYCKLGQVLQIGARVVTKWGAGNLLQSGSFVIAK